MRPFSQIQLFLYQGFLTDVLSVENSSFVSMSLEFLVMEANLWFLGPRSDSKD